MPGQTEERERERETFSRGLSGGVKVDTSYNRRYVKVCVVCVCLRLYVAMVMLAHAH